MSTGDRKRDERTEDGQRGRGGRATTTGQMTARTDRELTTTGSTTLRTTRQADGQRMTTATMGRTRWDRRTEYVR